MKGLTLDEHRAAMKEGHLLVAVCRSCGKQQAIPADTCFTCGSDELELKPHSGSGRVYSWVVCNYAFAEELAAETPYTVVMVELDGGGRVYGRLLAQDGAATGIGADTPLSLDAEVTKQRGYPAYRLAAAAQSTGT
jgi:uncharacterized OB-fold protein